MRVHSHVYRHVFWHVFDMNKCTYTWGDAYRHAGTRAGTCMRSCENRRVWRHVCMAGSRQGGPGCTMRRGNTDRDVAAGMDVMAMHMGTGG